MVQITVAAIGQNGSDTNFANKFEVTVSGYAANYEGDIFSLLLVKGHIQTQLATLRQVVSRHQ